MSEITAFEYVTNQLEILKEEDESDNAYLQRVAFEIQNLNDTEWNKLPEALQDWYNKTADIIAEASEASEMPEIPELPTGKKDKKPKKAKKVEVEEEEEVEVEEEEEMEDETEEPKKRGRKPKAETEEPKKRGRKPKAEKVPKEPRVKKEKTPKEPRGPTAAQAVREILCENMDLTLDEVMQELEKRGVAMKRSSCQVVTLNTVSAFEVAIQVGQVKNKAGEVVLSA